MTQIGSKVLNGKEKESKEDCFKANMTQIGSKVLNGKEKESKEHLFKKIASRLT